MSGPEHAADVREWLRRALDDLRWARHSNEGSFYPQSCFACQQAAEKALKAYLLALGRPLRRVHSLPDLLNEVVERDKEADGLRDSVIVLDTYYTPTRYADVGDERLYNRELVQEALSRAELILNWLRPRIAERLQEADEAAAE